MPTRDDVLKEYEAAVAQEQEARDHAFLDWLPWQVKAGTHTINLRLMRVRDFATLSAIANGCLYDAANAGTLDVLQFCTVLSFEELTPEKVAEKVGPMPDEPLRQSLAEYAKAMLGDTPASQTKGQSKSYYSYLAAITHNLATAYGWNRKEIMDTPMPAVYQLIKLQQRDADPKAPMFNPSDAILNQLVQCP
jgi:hypothetical protein